MNIKENICTQELYEKYLLMINNIRFTSREIDVIACLIYGKNTKSIASFLSNDDKKLEIRTIESHISNIKRKISAESREEVVKFIEKSGKYKLIQNYYLSLLIDQEFKKFLQEILILIKPSNISFIIVVQKLAGNHLNLLINKLHSDLQFIGITVVIKTQENVDNTIVLSSKHKEVGGTNTKQCTIYALNIEEDKIAKQENNNSITIYNDQDISKIFCLISQETQHIKCLFKSPNVEHIDLNIYQQYHFLFLAIVKKSFSNVNLDDVIVKFSEKYNDIIKDNINSIFPKTDFTEKLIKTNTPKKIYLFTTIGVVLIFCGICFFVITSKINNNIKKQEIENFYHSPKNNSNGKYNEDITSKDSIVPGIYFDQEKNSLKILEINMHLDKTDDLEILRCKILYLQSIYFLKIGNYQNAEKKLNKALYRYKNIKITNPTEESDLKNLHGKILFTRAKLSLINSNQANNKMYVQSIKEAISVFKETNNNVELLRSIELYGRLLILRKKYDKVIVTFNKYSDLIKKIADDKSKMFFYLTYSDAYLKLGNMNEALNYCNKAKQQAGKLHINNELNNYINNKEKTIQNLLHSTPTGS
ncbi:MAG: helix-turn-helix transcriptional regulator [Rickettsia endosymbiont of Labidopullus appendiculatus]|nr:helix-turn-helix transcriptional regulator [Rickettsia endosymbiont of Labidopullus appendiculatus]